MTGKGTIKEMKGLVMLTVESNREELYTKRLWLKLDCRLRF